MQLTIYSLTQTPETNVALQLEHEDLFDAVTVRDHAEPRRPSQLLISHLILSVGAVPEPPTPPSSECFFWMLLQ